MNISLAQRFANLRLFLSRSNVSFNEIDAARDVMAFVDEMERVVSVPPENLVPLTVPPKNNDRARANGKSA